MQEIGIGEFAGRSRRSTWTLLPCDELGTLDSARVDKVYGLGATTPPRSARLVALLRQSAMAPSDVKSQLTGRPTESADLIAGQW